MLGAIVLAGTVFAGLAPTAGAATRNCGVKNATQGTWFASWSGRALTTALERAVDGDRLNVFGRCRGNFGTSKSLSLFGNTNKYDPTILDGNGSGTVLFIGEPATTSLTRFIITGGNAVGFGGGGIQTGGNLTLNASKVVGNQTDNDGGGIFNYGNLTLNHTAVTRNKAGVGDGVARVGGGIFSEGESFLNFSSVTRNVATFGGGILSVNTLVLNSTIVTGNVPDDCGDPCP